jgi:hypothetical protein
MPAAAKPIRSASEARAKNLRSPHGRRVDPRLAASETLSARRVQQGRDPMADGPELVGSGCRTGKSTVSTSTLKKRTWSIEGWRKRP